MLSNEITNKYARTEGYRHEREREREMEGERDMMTIKIIALFLNTNRE